MAIVPVVGRRSWKVRFVFALLYLVLSVGAVTMVYPFLLMIGTSLTSDTDYADFQPVPKFLYDNSALFSKEVEIRQGGDMVKINLRYGADYSTLESIVPPQVMPPSPAKQAVLKTWNSSVNYFEGQVRGLREVQLPYLDVNQPTIQARLSDWQNFKKSLPVRYIIAAYAGRPAAPSSSPSRLLELYRRKLEERYGSIDGVNKAYVEENESFASMLPPGERETTREWNLDNTRKSREWLLFKQQLPERFKLTVGVDPIYQQFLRQNKYDDNIELLNKAWKSRYGFFTDIRLSEQMPATLGEKADWEEFIRTLLPFRFMRVDPSAVLDWQKFLERRYTRITELNSRQNAHYTSFQQIKLPDKLPPEGVLLTDWMDFIKNAAPITKLHPDGVENRYRISLQKRLGTVQALNKRYGTDYKSFQEVQPPYRLEDWDYVVKNAGSLRNYFAFANFKLVWDYIVRHGNAVVNTLFYVVLAITTHLLVNPLCAYALSRYNLRYGHRVLLFLLATMAFPAEVAMIPSFLLLKQFNLLNTFAALILPGMASGYSIFLLKGFFDSLPKELYEAGIIDGANEGRMFWQITVPLSKPVLAVIALSSFTAAYGNFMFAFLVCQNPKMWTIMVWLYELQILSPSYVVMAALTLAAIPTLLVFIFCQNIIMRGIILPSFK